MASNTAAILHARLWTLSQKHAIWGTREARNEPGRSTIRHIVPAAFPHHKNKWCGATTTSSFCSFSHPKSTYDRVSTKRFDEKCSISSSADKQSILSWHFVEILGCNNITQKTTLNAAGKDKCVQCTGRAAQQLLYFFFISLVWTIAKLE